MTAMAAAHDCVADAERLVAAIKTEDMTLDDARRVTSLIRLAEGWLQSARILLDPSEVL